MIVKYFSYENILFTAVATSHFTGGVYWKSFQD